MNRKKRKRRRVSRKFIQVHWGKKNPDGKARFEEACKREGQSASAILRALGDEWARTILAKKTSAIEAAARTVAKKKK